MARTVTKEFINMTNRQTTPVMAPERLAFASGIAFSLIQFGALLYFVSLVFPQMGPPEATAQHIAFYTQHGETLRLGNYLLTLPTPFFLFFLGGLFGVLRRAENGGSALAATASSAGLSLPFSGLSAPS